MSRSYKFVLLLFIFGMMLPFNVFAKESVVIKTDKEFLEEELKRINQKELIKVDKVIDVIIDSINNKDIKSGEVIRIYE